MYPPRLSVITAPGISLFYLLAKKLQSDLRVHFKYLAVGRLGGKCKQMSMSLLFLLQAGTLYLLLVMSGGR